MASGWKFYKESGTNRPVFEMQDGTKYYPVTLSEFVTLTQLNNHINDTTDAHDASAISFVPAGTVAATDVQAAIEEVASEGGVSDHGGLTGLADDDHTQYQLESEKNAANGYLGIGASIIQAPFKFYPVEDDGATQTAAALYAGTGAPNNANGADGDYYFRSDGGALTSIYHKRLGAWVGVA